MNLYAVSAADRDDALAAGEQGRVLQTKDGGLTWETQPTVTAATLFGVAYRGGTDAWVAGRGGTILRRTDEVATVKIPRPSLRRDSPPRLQNSNAALPHDDDIPRAVPPSLKRVEKP